MTFHRRIALILPLATVAAWIAMATQSAHAETNDDILRTPQRLLSQERQQMDAGRRLGKVVRRIDWLLEDLKSNGMVSEAGGEQYARAKKQLTSVASTHAPKAVELLRNARADLAGAHVHLDGADQEIETIVVKLDLALGGASDALLGDLALRQLRQVIKQQAFLKQQTETLVKNKTGEKTDFERLGKAQKALSQPTNGLVTLLSEEKPGIDELTKERFAAAAGAMQGAPHLMMQTGMRIPNHTAVHSPGEQGAILVRLRKAERFLTGEEPSVADLLKDLRRLLELEKKLKQEVERADAEQRTAEKTLWFLRQGDIRDGVDLWVGITLTKDGPIDVHLRQAYAACERARANLAFLPHEGHATRAINWMNKAIAALEQALVIGEQQRAEMNNDEQGPDERFDPAIGFDPDELEPERLGGEGEEQTDGGKKQRDKGLGDAEKPPKDGEEVDTASGSEGKPGDPGPSEGEGKGGPVGGGEAEEADDTGLGISPDLSKIKRFKMSNSESPRADSARKSGGVEFEDLIFETDPPTSEIEFSSRGTRPHGRQARDAVSRRRRSAAIKKYVEKLPPEFRQQVADYYEALAK